MTLQAFPVTLDNGAVHAADGSPLPAHARAVLVILPETSDAMPTDWEHSFDAFFALAAASKPSADLDTLSEADLNALTHTARPTA